MEREELESLLIEYIDGKLDRNATESIEQLLRTNEDAAKLHRDLQQVMYDLDGVHDVDPSPKLKAKFEAMLQREGSLVKTTRTLLFRPVFYQVAATVALLIVAVSAGYWISEYQNQQAEIAKIKQENIELMAMIRNTTSAGQRILGVQAAYKSEEVTDEIIEALIATMNSDPNSNVRLAAIDALRKFDSEPAVRKALIASLNHQKDPVVQITLIQLMVEMKEKKAIQSLQKILEADESLPAVKDEAQAGLLTLS